MKHNFKTGRLGLSGPEIEAEMQNIFEAMCQRRNLDPEDSGSQVGTGHFRTPTEIHREQVLWAMRMANSVICYDGGKDNWDTYATEYRHQHLWREDGLGHVRKFGYNKVQDEAYALSEEETDAIWTEQKARMSRATVLHNVGTDSEGCSYNSIKW